MKNKIMEWLQDIEKQDGMPPEVVIAFNFGLFESDQGYMVYLVGGFEYSEEDDDWACLEPPANDYRYLRFPDDIQSESWESILDYSEKILKELEREGAFNQTLIKNAKAITTGFDDGGLRKIR